MFKYNNDNVNVNYGMDKMDVSKDDWVRSKIFSSLPRKIDYAQWCDASSSIKSKEHVRLLLDVFYESMLHYINDGNFSTLESRIENDHSFYAPYAIEGAGMAFGILSHCRYTNRDALDSSYFRKANVKRLFSFGVGMSVGFLGLSFEKCCNYMERLSFRAIKDGYGFYSGIQLRHQVLEQGKDLINSGPQDFGLWNGYGRSLWFLSSSNPENLFKIVQALPQRSRGAVWRGIGLAAIFTGGAEIDVIKRLRDLCTECSQNLAHGAKYGLYLRGKAHENYPDVQKTKDILCKPLRLTIPSYQNISAASGF